MLKFIDLFAGIGGFHLALKKLGHQCVFACEIDKTLAKLYEKTTVSSPKAT
jgi:DNA (cytosine-5)-methyltransferase 1